ncbi:MAG: lipase family protein, partial [Persicimonas sp.]
MKFRMRVISVGLVFFVVACSGDVGDDSSNASTDAGTDVGADGDVGDDASTDAGEDASTFECEEFPTAQIAGTEQTDELAENPARCGQSEYSWLDGSQVGQVTEVGHDEEFSKGLIEGILASQDVDPPSEIAHDAEVLTYEYATQDRGQEVTATSMLAYPKGVQPAESPSEVLLFLHGTTGFTDECAASDGGAYKGLAALFASMGYFVVAPDFIGLKSMGEETGFLHPYLVGQATAIASLDAVRAAADLPAEERGDLCVNPRVLPIGGSQGGHAALWVDRLAPYYARELEMLGSVATVPPADMLGQMERAVDQLVDASGNTVAFLGSTAGWYGYEDDLDEVFVEPLDEEVPEN